MMPVPSGVRVWLAVGRTDMRRGMNSRALQGLKRSPHAGDFFCLPRRARRSDQDSPELVRPPVDVVRGL